MSELAKQRLALFMSQYPPDAIFYNSFADDLVTALDAEGHPLRVTELQQYIFVYSLDQFEQRYREFTKLTAKELPDYRLAAPIFAPSQVSNR